MSQPRTTRLIFAFTARFFFEDELSLTTAAGAVPLQPGEEEDEVPLLLLVPGEEQMDEFLRMTLYTVQ